ncbi:helix-turn-helix transcriptional regulator [Streptomyces niveiscabiei]|uniref:helix-turn-helix domain-containing protein n=1 Tax=Streptomyces niveiscabiei TaxID=164115 RepID=UPI0029A32D8B|nr:helix-turn-helix transcriptional regulator [Streptomyces niveiscabiei]MDX3387592.1 helix-turn-helix transcriptional regulator [Streptomyces niveiscabiei]
MSATVGADDIEEFAAMLRALKDRSGLSYGTLAKRLHMSTSTLHRYCNGTAVPPEYAPVERLARACRATPEELVDLHRHWILADTARRRRTKETPAPYAPGEAAPATDDTEAASPEKPEPGSTEQPEKSPHPEPTTPSWAKPPQPTAPAPAPAEAPDTLENPPPSRKLPRKAVLLAAAALATALTAAALVANRPGEASPGGRTAGRTTPTTAATSPNPSPTPSPSTSGTPSASPSTPSPLASAKTSSPAPEPTGAPLTVRVRPYVYESPCSQEFLVDSEPAQMGPPATEPDAPRFVSANGAVSANQQVIGLTLQGTGSETVVLEALHVRILTKHAPLAWNVYGMGSGCGGNVETKSFAVDLDQGSPAVTVRGGQRDFPYKISESDPEVFYVKATTTAHDVRWDLTLDWSSGSRTGTVRISDAGTPFRTSADDGRDIWDYPLGGNEWIRTPRNEGQTP